MTIAEFTERLKTAKVKDLELLFRTTAAIPEKSNMEVVGMFYGIKGKDNVVTSPQVGDEPNCVVVQVNALT